MKYSVFVFIIICLFATGTLAQNNKPISIDTSTPFILGTIEKIQSNTLQETRTLNIYLPDGYSPDAAAAYPAIYLLDGSANEDFIHVAGIVQFLTMIEAMPKSIVIGIANVDRKRDFTFPTSIEKDKKDFPTTGGSEKFMLFIEKELLPFIQKKYKTTSSKTIIGQSLGGLFAAEVLLKRPYLFTNYFIVSPSFWWNNESLLTAAPALLQQQPDNNIQVYISVGNEGKIMESDAKRFAGALQAAGKQHLHTSFVPLPAENHLTILHNSVYKGFQLLHPEKTSLAK